MSATPSSSSSRPLESRVGAESDHAAARIESARGKPPAKAAGLTGRLVHDLRRTAVRNLERAGVSRSVAMKLTGHKTEAVYRRYAITSAADLSEGVAKLATLHGLERDARTVLPFATGTIRAQSTG